MTTRAPTVLTKWKVVGQTWSGIISGCDSLRRVVITLYQVGIHVCKSNVHHNVPTKMYRSHAWPIIQSPAGENWNHKKTNIQVGFISDKANWAKHSEIRFKQLKSFISVTLSTTFYSPSLWPPCQLPRNKTLSSTKWRTWSWLRVT